MAKKSDFEFVMPQQAERLGYGELSSEERESLLLSQENQDRSVYRVCVVIEPRAGGKAKRKYKWCSVIAVSFGIELLSENVSFVGGLFPKKNHRELTSNISMQLDAIPTNKFVTAQATYQAMRTIPGSNWGVHAQRTDRYARWLLKRRWLDENDFPRFEVVCSIPATSNDVYANCKMVGIRAGAEEVANKKALVVLPCG